MNISLIKKARFLFKIILNKMRITTFIGIIENRLSYFRNMFSDIFPG